MNSLLKKFFGFSIGPLISTFISVITVPITTYFIVPSEYGKASLFVTIQSIMLMIIYLGFDQSYVREYNEVEDKHKLLINCLILPLFISLCILIFFPWYYKILSKWLFGDIYVLPIFLFAISLIFVTFERFILLSIRMEEKAVLYSSISILLKLANFVMTFVFIFILQYRNFLTVVYSNLLGQMFIDIILIIAYRKRVTVHIKYIDVNYVNKLLKYGAPLAVVSIIGYLLNSIDTIFLKYLSTYEELGYYSVAARITGFLSMIQNAFSSFWAPVSFRWYKENKPIRYYEHVGNSLCMGMSFLTALIILFKELLPIFISSSYKNSLTIIPFLLFYPLMYTLGITTELGMQFQRKSYLSLYISIITLIINIILNIVLIPIFGARGAAFATGISYIIFFWSKTIVSRNLWKRFEIKCYLFSTIILVIMALWNTFINNEFTLIFNLLIIFLLIIFYRKVILYWIKIFLGRKKNA